VFAPDSGRAHGREVFLDAETRDHPVSKTSVGQVPMDRLRSIFDGMFDGVWLVASSGRTTYTNAAMAGLLGYTPGDMHGRLITDFLDYGSTSRAFWRASGNTPANGWNSGFAGPMEATCSASWPGARS